MIRYSIVILFCATAFSAFGQGKVVGLSELEKVMSDPSKDIKVINFWATWCGPCIKELPFFEKLSNERKDIAVTLVSVDYVTEVNESKINKFIARKKLTAPVLILDEPNKYVEAIEPGWSGAIPATIVINTKTGKRKFVEKELQEGDLEKLLDEVQN